VGIPAGTYRLGPENGTLSVRTRRTGAAAKAGHDLHFHVTSWTAVLELADDPAASWAELSADGGSLRVIAGTGGVTTLSDGDKRGIEQTVDTDVLRGQNVVFRSTTVDANGGGLRLQGELTLMGATRPHTVDLTLNGDGDLRGETVIRQTEHGMKPYSTLVGALRVVDDVGIELDARLPT
jgi:polyisoprenoid-binding protein YceI